MVNATGLLTIFLVMVESTAALYVEDTLGQERLARFCDRTFFVVVLVGYVAVNVALPLAARASVACCRQQAPAPMKARRRNPAGDLIYLGVVPAENDVRVDFLRCETNT